MKKYLIALMLCLASFSAVYAEGDTIRINSHEITSVIADTTLNSKGKTTVKYYFLYRGELVNTTKTVVEKYRLAQKYGARVELVLIKKSTSKKIIIL